jgi:hypothetical protein
MTFTSPNISSSSFGSCSGCSGTGGWLRKEPCGVPDLINPSHNINVTLHQDFRDYEPADNDTDYVNGTITIELEETLVPSLPYFDSFPTDGILRFRTVKINEPYENKDLLIRLSTKSEYGEISDYLRYVSLATGGECTTDYPEFKTDNWMELEVPDQSGWSYNVTVPARDIWHISFATTNQAGDIFVDYMLVNRPEPIESLSFIPCLNWLVIGLLVFSIFIYY